MPEELYFKDNTTGEFKLAKRKEDSLHMAVLKLNKEREDIKKDIESNNKLIEAKFSMFETLLKERLDYTCKEIDEVRDDTEESNRGLKKSFEIYAQSLVERQRIINKQVEEKFEVIEVTIKDHGKRISTLENKPIVAAATKWNKIVLLVGGALSGVVIIQLKNIIEFIINLFVGN
jgi:hypothetical protein